MDQPSGPTWAAQTIILTFVLWIFATVVTVALPSFIRVGQIYEIAGVLTVKVLPCIMLGSTLARFKTLHPGITILGLLPPILVLFILMMWIVTKL